ncbi:intradiol ring-cleavage dioxygenase [Sphingomonas sp. BK580]|uniref:intradiol ring-cleavage dioxygenase n=1 Tax=Sphingomonas sp. BK580 TaxID=2586972 RepID=UPI00182AC365|nr:intradiol ring-cleavage dioxygenase [Sphingomonas sp. BK580]MBB3694643.1 hydroxyquinol 1,2-dioxygenase [Sphingomonas sp. BK580]
MMDVVREGLLQAAQPASGALDETMLTEAVIDRVRGAPDPRVRQISEALVRHLHAFIREVEPTEDEWRAGIDFLTATGQMCSATRQEFILLSDTLGVSMLVDQINHRLPGVATETTVFGPFYVDAPVFREGGDISGHFTGLPLYIDGTVHNEAGEAIEGASVDIWHSDEHGFYDLQKLSEGSGLAGRGRFFTGPDGSFRLWTVRPTAYPIPDDGPVGRMLSAQGRHPFRPEHVHFMIANDGYRTLVTHLFAQGGQYLESDVVFGVKKSLIRAYEEHEGGIAPDGRSMGGPWLRLNHDFVLATQA